MVATKIADIIVPSVFNPYVIERTAALSAFFQSGVVTDMSAVLDLTNGGKTVNMPFFQDLSGSSQVLSDSASLTVNSIGSGQDIGALIARGNAWGVNDLAKALSGADPMGAIADLVAGYWSREFQTILIQELTGVFLAASMSGNLHDISGLTGSNAVISAGTTIDAMGKLGDAKGKLTAIAMHSSVVEKLTKDDLITTIRDSEGNATIRTYLGKRVIEDDGMPVSSGVYDSYLFGEGSLGFANTTAPVETEVDRDSLAGEDILINRRHFVLHPRGVAWVGTATGATPTNGELAIGTNWLRKWENKNIRIVKFKHKIA